ncbi:MAG: serine--tRNA ligase [Planctomycetota bacterium]|nr:serine--tRNA ligase [Planctomycetota bacterium]
MLDIKLIRADPELVRAGCAKKRIKCDVDRILELDDEFRGLAPQIDELRASQKLAGKAIAKASPEERAKLLEEQKQLKTGLKELEERMGAVQAELKPLLLTVPNLPAAEVPDGLDDSDNVELRKWGTPRLFDFEPLDHVDLGERQGWMNTEVAARLGGSRNYITLGELARLEHAVLRFAMDLMIERGFDPAFVPVLVRREPLEGTGYFPGGIDQIYMTDERDELYLVGTAEVPLTSIHAGEILSEEQLPVQLVAQSSCFRREAGTYGKDTRGLYRVHQFQKVEQVVIDVADEARSLEHHAAILKNAEDLLQAFELPYRVVNVCGGDLGAPQVQKFDVETWMPSREGYGETHSASRFHDFQARRLSIRYRDKEGKVHYCHTLNNTVAASSRLLIALMENHQLPDGRVAVPSALRPHMGGLEVIGKPIREVTAAEAAEVEA